MSQQSVYLFPFCISELSYQFIKKIPSLFNRQFSAIGSTTTIIAYSGIDQFGDYEDEY